MHSSFQKILFFDIDGVLLSNGWGNEARQAAACILVSTTRKMNYLHEFIFNLYEICNINLDEYLDTVLFYRTRNFLKKEFIDFMYAQSVQLPSFRWCSESPFG